MALADLDAFKDALISGPERLGTQFVSSSATSGRWSDTWLTAPPVGAMPTTAVVPTRATAGALGQQNGGAGRLSILGARMNLGFMSGHYMICDRLSHQGGLDGTVTTAQTTNLPTAALTRYTSGEGVMIGLTIATVVGTTGTTVSASYTNTTPTAARTSPLVVFGGSAFREANRMILLPLQAGDTGVTSVESVTVTDTTGTAGNFGVTLFRPLLAVVIGNHSEPVSTDFITGYSFGGIPEIVNDACLFVMATGFGNNLGGAGSLLIAEV